MPTAGILRRFFASLIDFVFSIFLSALVSFGASFIPYLPNFLLFFLLGIPILFFIYQAVSISLWGSTLGKKLLNIGVIGKNENKPSFTTELLREFIYKFISIIPAGIGFSLAVFKDEPITWYDKKTGTRVVLTNQSQGLSKAPGRVRKIVSFAFLLLFLGFIEFQFLWGFLYVYQQSVTIPCFFQDGGLLTESPHFKVYLEKGEKEIDPQGLKLMLEQAFDYSFWLISLLSSKTGTISVCLYQDPQSFSEISSSEGLDSYCKAFATYRNQTIHFSPEFTLAPPEEQRGTAYHEINHYVLFVLLLDKEYKYIAKIPTYFEEGLAELVEGNYEIGFLKIVREVSGRAYGWRKLSQPGSTIKSGPENSFYNDEALLIMKFLEEKYGIGIFSKIVQSAVGSNQPIEKALEEVTGQRVAVLEEEWLKWLRTE